MPIIMRIFKTDRASIGVKTLDTEANLATLIGGVTWSLSPGTQLLNQRRLVFSVTPFLEEIRS